MKNNLCLIIFLCINFYVLPHSLLGEGYIHTSPNYNITPSISERKKIKINVNTKNDNRKVVNASIGLWQTVGKITIAGFNKVNQCTGTMIAKNMVLTAAHCLYNHDNKSWVKAQKIHFLAGFNKDKHVGHSIVKEYFISPKFNSKYFYTIENLPNDWGILILKDDIIIDKYAEILQDFSKVAKHIKQGKYFVLAGYPKYRSYRLSVNNNCKIDQYAVDFSLLYHSCPINNGDSGGPILLQQGNDTYIIGISNAHLRKRNSESSKKSINTAVPIVNLIKKINLLKNYKK